MSDYCPDCGCKHGCLCGDEAPLIKVKSSFVAPAGSPAPPDKSRLLQAVEDFVWNVEHSHVQGWGDVSRDTVADNSFKELKAAMHEAQENE